MDTDNQKPLPPSKTKDYKRDVQKAFREKHAERIREKNRERYQKKKSELNDMRTKLKEYESSLSRDVIEH